MLIATVINIHPGKQCLNEILTLATGVDYSDNSLVNASLAFVFVYGGCVVCICIKEILLVVNVCAGFFAL